MDLNTIITAISTVGFPIFACIALGLYIYKLQTKSNDVIIENTKVLTELVIMIKEMLNKKGD